MTLKPMGTSFNVYIDADFAGNWKASEADSCDTACSRHGYIILYATCPILWALQLQMEIELSSTESEFHWSVNCTSCNNPNHGVSQGAKGPGI